MQAEPADLASWLRPLRSRRLPGATRGRDAVPLVGARTRERLAEVVGAFDLGLTVEELAALEEAMPHDAAAGERYNA